ncbi:MAG: hypothetical protein COA96_16575 [SAR86 cluster bacterium]|uniref:TonB C-terminal domain-containing protein n=1 Tax=SAR86 cluster bacterium TaxID=2030880 RepID=A0A2A5AHW1_9GAMM|nr:MAG: hypothetical protein COA96_16575 [SAR86 cluster bacterium]
MNTSLTTYNTHTNRRQLLAFCLSLAVLIVMFGLLSLKKNLEELVKDELTIREVSLAPPPPPPPPPQQQQKRVEAEIQLNVDGKGPPVVISEVKRQDPLEALQLVSPDIKTLTTDWEFDLQVDWSAYGLDELDGIPTLLTSMRIDWPRTLSNRGVDRAIVRLDVFIDETGRVTLVSILENSYPQLNNSIERVVRTARYSIPQKAGQAVRARFIWPVEFVKP